MQELSLISILMILFLIATGFAFYPLYKQKWVYGFTVIMAGCTGLAYWCWGGYSVWHVQLQKEAKLARVQKILKTMNGPQEVIQKLEARLKADPNSGRGWYLLGRLHASQNHWKKAHQAFAKAHDLKPDNIQITLNLVQSRLVLNKHLGKEDHHLLYKILAKQKNQPDALMLLANEAYERKQYQQAIDYWQRLLSVVPEGSEEAQQIHKAIVKAQQLN